MAASSSVYWITGMSGAGKTTVASLLARQLREQGLAVFELDGDVYREIVGKVDAHSREERLELALSYGRFARELSRQGITVVCATISLFHQVHDWNRANLEDYREIYLRVPREELERRDPKGIYRKVRTGEMRNVVGVDVAAEEPQNPDAVIENYGSMRPEQAAAAILERFPPQKKV